MTRQPSSNHRAHGPAAPTWRPVAVLDLETAPDPRIAGRVAGGGGRKAAIERPALHSLDAISILRCEMSAEGGVRDVSLTSMSTLRTGEAAMRAEITRTARTLAAADGTLVTFNGTGHDVPFARHRLLATARYADAATLVEVTQLDVMLDWAGGGRFPRLTDLCAATGLPVWGQAAEWGGVDERENKSRLDVCATFVLALMLLASRGRWKASTVHEGWRAMSAAVLAGGVDDPNLLALLRQPAAARTR